jgi:hypothetical protein
VQIPDVTGHLLKDARDLLNKAGIMHIEVRLTAPPRVKGIEPGDMSRVVRQKTTEDGNTIELVVCSTKY